MPNDDYEGHRMVAKGYEPTGEELRQLQELGFRGYDREQRVMVLTEEGIMHFLSVFNGMKREVKELKKKVQASIPMAHLADRAMNALKRDPDGEKHNFQRTEDMLATWSAANGDAGSDVLEKMDACYEQAMEKQRKEEERRWLFEHGGKNVSVNGPYNDQSTTHETHFT